MTQGTVGWLCPKCSTVVSPYQATCTACCVSVMRGYAGTFSLGNITYSGMGTISLGGSLGTMYAAPKPDPKDVQLREWREWRDRVVEIRDELNELIEEVEDDE